MYRDDDEAAALKLGVIEGECAELEEAHLALRGSASEVEARLARTKEALRERGYSEKGVRAFLAPASCALIGLLVGSVVTPDLLVWNLGLGLASLCTIVLVVLSVAQRRRHARELAGLEARVQQLEAVIEAPVEARVLADDEAPEEIVDEAPAEKWRPGKTGPCNVLINSPFVRCGIWQ